MFLINAGKAPVVSTGPVLVDVSAFGVISALGTSKTYTNFANIGSGSNGTTNRALLCAVLFIGSASGTVTSPSVTWNGTSLTQIGGAVNRSASGDAGDAFWFGMVAPATGTHDLVVSWTGTSQCIVGALSVVGANQTGGTTTFRNGATASGNSTTGSVNPTIVSGDLAMDLVMDFVTAANNQNNTYIGNSDAGSSQAGGIAYGTTTPMTWTFTSSPWVMGAMCIAGA